LKTFWSRNRKKDPHQAYMPEITPPSSLKDYSSEDFDALEYYMCYSTHMAFETAVSKE